MPLLPLPTLPLCLRPPCLGSDPPGLTPTLSHSVCAYMRVAADGLEPLAAPPPSLSPFARGMIVARMVPVAGPSASGEREEPARRSAPAPFWHLRPAHLSPAPRPSPAP